MGVVERSISECSDDIDIRPLELTDLQRDLNEVYDDTLRCSLPGLNDGNKFFSVVYGLEKKRGDTADQHKKMLTKMAWKNAYNKVKVLGDPWAQFHIGKLVTEKATRYRYKALQKKWVEDQVLVKIEEKPFNNGAMRECYRMKKLSNFSNDDWSKAHNYVAKRYMDLSTVEDTYFDDVNLQMDAKLWGEEFNRHNPPKKVDIFQMAVLRLSERPGRPLYHVEHFIEGAYVKYNSNSGYVSSSNRMTPHAFSHFTFERSGHELIVVDVQGVGDLYTDPQIHTAAGTDYGDGNLGTRGMALFFHSHSCNSICFSLGLSHFDMAPSEIRALNGAQMKALPQTVIRGTEELVSPPTDQQRSNLHEYLRQRSLSSGCLSQDDESILDSIDIMGCSHESLGSVDEDLVDSVESVDSAISSATRQPRLPQIRRTVSHTLDSTNSRAPDTSNRRSSGGSSNGGVERSPGHLVHGMALPPRRRRLDSSSSECDSVTHVQEMNNFSVLASNCNRPSNILSPVQHLELLRDLDAPRQRGGQTVLGQVHLDLAKYYELHRFSSAGELYDVEAAVYHVLQAAHCGVLDAVLAAVQLHLGLHHALLPGVQLDDCDRDTNLGFYFLEEACRAGDRWALVYLGTALETGAGLPETRVRNWPASISLYGRVVDCSGDDEGGYDALVDTPAYDLRARQARMMATGGYGLDKDPLRAGELYSEAAELATVAMKGKLASKYYMAAEEAWME